MEEDKISLNNETVMADISSLPTEVAGYLTGKAMEVCVAKIGKAAMKYLNK